MELISELWNKDSEREVPGVLAVAIDEDRLVDIGHHGHVSFKKQELLHLLEVVSWRAGMDWDFGQSYLAPCTRREIILMTVALCIDRIFGTVNQRQSIDGEER